MFGRRDLRLLGFCMSLSVAAAASLLVLDAHWAPAPEPASTIDGPYANLLASSTDLGPSQLDRAQLTVGLRGSARPEPLQRWAASKGLDVRWQPGEEWAIVEGAPPDVAEAFDVPVHDYRGMQGQVFYASAKQPEVPTAVRDTVSDLGRILGFTPHREARPDMIPLDVPPQGLTPNALLTAYNASPLAAAGFTGKGQTIVFFAFSGYDQTDLDDFATMSGLPPLKPILVGGQPSESRAETVMDLEVAHAIAPDARMVVVNARPTLEGGRTYERIGEMFDADEPAVPRRGVEPVDRMGMRRVDHRNRSQTRAVGTGTRTATRDVGLRCQRRYRRTGMQGRSNWSSPPGPDDIGLDAVASLPAITSVGGTTLSTDENGQWLAEQAWVDSPLSQGTSGGVSKLFPRPAWQQRVSANRDSASASAD